MERGIFITFEGPEGAGKTTLIKLVKEALEELGYDKITTTREPGGSTIAEKIRQVILDVNHVNMDARTEALLFAAARRQHLVEIVNPALRAGHIVLCDRFVDSSLAYQGIARGLDMEAIWTINQFAIEGQLPDLTCLIDVPAEVGLARIQAERSGHKIDRLDRESLEFHNQVRQAFLNLAKDNKRFAIIDGQEPIQVVVDHTLGYILARLEK